ncbi:hypothetical protein CPB83DRAFT_861857 [Crepidotus variabilis]|uniref:Uncharacterized protein n=1 Tax=Crepidotus variabilis TaxID=179855 RepID=A0A9P6E7S1_9AGAR|nr:hypothetical protein CPB83DRAFT_861857 [Crepidotus variabilis]
MNGADQPSQAPATTWAALRNSASHEYTPFSTRLVCSMLLTLIGGCFVGGLNVFWAI